MTFSKIQVSTNRTKNWRDEIHTFSDEMDLYLFNCKTHMILESLGYLRSETQYIPPLGDVQGILISLLFSECFPVLMFKFFTIEFVQLWSTSFLDYDEMLPHLM